MPLTRLVRGVRYSAGLLLSAREIAEGLTRGEASRVARLIRLATGIVIGAIGCSGAVTGITLIAPRLGITASVGVTCMALSWVLGGIGLIADRFTGPLPVCGCLLACAANIAFYQHQGGISHLLWAAFFLCVPLVAVAVELWTRRRRRLWRAAHDAMYPGCTRCFPANAAGQGQGVPRQP